MLRPDTLSYPPQNHRDGALESRKLDMFPTAAINTFHSENWNTVVPPEPVEINGGQGTKIFQYYTCPAGRVTYSFYPANTCTCPLKAYAIQNIRE